jgi:hypothetical protein
MDYDVLENIKRRNLDQHKIDEIFALCDRNNIPVYTEIILGLPGDTVEAWKENFWKIFRAGNHTGINILQAQLLENAEMNLFQKKLWKLDSVPVYDYMSGSFGDMQWPESVDVVIATRDIPQEQMLDTMQWNTFIQTFHINGMSTWLARFVHKYLGVDYPEFYQALEQHCQTHAWLNTELNKTRDYFKNWLTKVEKFQKSDKTPNGICSPAFKFGEQGTRPVASPLSHITSRHIFPLHQGYQDR